VHTWLPDAHVEAPTAGSVILAAIPAEDGGYGFLLFSLPMFRTLRRFSRRSSLRSRWWRSSIRRSSPWWQEDMKKLIAYSSVAHMGSSPWHLRGDHAGRGGRHLPDDLARPGVGALFLCVGVVYDRVHTRKSPPMGAS